MAKVQRRGTEEARAELPALIAAAERGKTTIITRHGRSIAAIVPIGEMPGSRQKSLLDLAGSGKGLWGRNSQQTLRKLRDEWPQ